MSCDEISADWAAQRIKGLVLWTRHVERAAATRSRAPQRRQGRQVIKTLIDSFQYPRKGPGMMWEAAAPQGQATRRRHPHGHDGRRACATTTDARLLDRRRVDGDGRTKRRSSAEHVISSAPIRELVGGITPEPRLQGVAPPSELRYRDFLTVALIVEKPRPVPRQLDLHPRARA